VRGFKKLGCKKVECGILRMGCKMVECGFLRIECKMVECWILKMEVMSIKVDFPVCLSFSIVCCHWCCVPYKNMVLES